MIAADDFVEVNSPEEIPDFANEDEEHEFWQTHCLGPGMLSRMRRVAEGQQLRAALPPTHRYAIAVRFEGDIIRRLAALAVHKGTGYETLLKEFVVERLYEEEKREGLVE